MRPKWQRWPRRVAIALGLLTAPAAIAEQRIYGEVRLEGLAHPTWGAGDPLATPVVCNVNGPDGWLAVRSGPGTQHEIRRKLKRLVIFEVNKDERVGPWVKVWTAYRLTDENGRRIARKSLHVEGWAHTGYLCNWRWR